jgi:antitoxin YefM
MTAEPLTRVSSADFSKNVDQYIEKANSTHAAFEVQGPNASVVVLSRQDFDGWQETLHLLSSPANARNLKEGIADLEAGRSVEYDPRRR